MAVGLVAVAGTTTAHSFTNNAPTWYAWLPADAATTWKWVGLGIAAAVALAFAGWLLARRRRLAPQEMLLVAATLSLVIPLLLPEMHERYFYLGEVLAVLAIFVDRRFLVVAALMQIATLSTYWSYLQNTTTLSLGTAAGVRPGRRGGCDRDPRPPAPKASDAGGMIEPCCSSDWRRPGPRWAPPAAGWPSAT